MFPVLCSGFLWEVGCADSNYCEVSFDFLSFLVGFGLSVFLLLLAVVDYLMRWFGSGLCLDKCYFHRYNDDLAF